MFACLSISLFLWKMGRLMTSLSLRVFCPQCINDMQDFWGKKRSGGRDKGGPVREAFFTHSLADSIHISKSLRVNIDWFVNHNMGKNPHILKKWRDANIRLVFTDHIQFVSNLQGQMVCKTLRKGLKRTMGWTCGGAGLVWSLGFSLWLLGVAVQWNCMGWLLRTGRQK